MISRPHAAEPNFCLIAFTPFIMWRCCQPVYSSAAGNAQRDSSASRRANVAGLSKSSSVSELGHSRLFFLPVQLPTTRSFVRLQDILVRPHAQCVANLR